MFCWAFLSATINCTLALISLGRSWTWPPHLEHTAIISLFSHGCWSACCACSPPLQVKAIPLFPRCCWFNTSRSSLTSLLHLRLDHVHGEPSWAPHGLVTVGRETPASAYLIVCEIALPVIDFGWKTHLCTNNESKRGIVLFLITGNLFGEWPRCATDRSRSSMPLTFISVSVDWFQSRWFEPVWTGLTLSLDYFGQQCGRVFSLEVQHSEACYRRHVAWMDCPNQMGCVDLAGELLFWRAHTCIVCLYISKHRSSPPAPTVRV